MLFSISLFVYSTFSVTPFVPFTPSIDAASTPGSTVDFLHSPSVISNVAVVSLCPFTMRVTTEPVPMLPRMTSVAMPPFLELPSFSTTSVVFGTALSLALPTKLGCSDFTGVSPLRSCSLLGFLDLGDKMLPAISTGRLGGTVGAPLICFARCSGGLRPVFGA